MRISCEAQFGYAVKVSLLHIRFRKFSDDNAKFRCIMFHKTAMMEITIGYDMIRFGHGLLQRQRNNTENLHPAQR